MPEPEDTANQARPAVRVLILDDSRADRRQLARLLTRAGLTVTPDEAAELAGFIAALDSEPRDLVFIDYALAGESGLEALELLAAHPLQTNAAPVFVTGNGQLDVAVAAMRRGCVDYLRKDDLSADEVRRAIVAAVERKLLPSAADGERRRGDAVLGAIERFDRASVDELREIMRRLADRARGMRTRADDSRRFFEDVAAIDNSCERMWAQLGDLGVEGIGAAEPQR